MFDEEFVLFPGEDDEYRACYLTDELKIEYMMPWITDGYTDLIKCLNHEWLHGLIDWALDGTCIGAFKGKWDEQGKSDHYIMRSINYD